MVWFPLYIHFQELRFVIAPAATFRQRPELSVIFDMWLCDLGADVYTDISANPTASFDIPLAV